MKSVKFAALCWFNTGKEKEGWRITNASRTPNESWVELWKIDCPFNLLCRVEFNGNRITETIVLGER